MSIEIPVIFDHEDFIVINKPSGIEMHDPINGVCHLLCRQLNIAKVFLVHRLDTPTSGCLLLAKNKSTAATLSQLFADRKIEKYYIAISDKKPKKKQGKIAGDMKKSRNGNYMLTPPCSSQAQAISFFTSENIEASKRLFYIKPVTGKTHQIRVALKSIGSPIIGDKRYKGTKADRLYLHSMMLSFTFFDKKYNIHCMPQSGEFFSSERLNPACLPNTINWPKYKPPKQSTVAHS